MSPPSSPLPTLNPAPLTRRGALCRGGFSVYQYQGVAANQGNRASFDRPMGCGLFFNWEHDFICFCERSGIPLEYAVNADLEPEAGGAELLANYSLVLSVGHDECKCRRTFSVAVRRNPQSR